MLKGQGALGKMEKAELLDKGITESLISLKKAKPSKIEKVSDSPVFHCLSSQSVGSACCACRGIKSQGNFSVVFSLWPECRLKTAGSFVISFYSSCMNCTNTVLPVDTESKDCWSPVSAAFELALCPTPSF